MGRRRSPLTWVEDRGQWIIAYTAYSPSGPLVSLAETKDFTSFQRLGPVMPPEDKDAAVFPRRFGNRYAMIHRPVSAGSSGAHIWLSFSPDLTHWGDHHVLFHARRGAWWDANRIGLSPPPLETPEGWLILYHGVRMTAGGCLYRLGLALLDLEDPSRVLRRSDEWVFAPELPYERQGDVNGVVFPCGWILDKPSGEIRLYYGGADTCLALATAQLSDLLMLPWHVPCTPSRKHRRTDTVWSETEQHLEQRLGPRSCDTKPSTAKAAVALCGCGVCRSPSPAIFAASSPGSSIPAAKRGSATSSSASSDLSGGQVDRLLDEVFLKFRTRHGNIAAVLEENYRTAMAMIGLSDDFSHNRRLLIGSYLTAEYSIESAALFNPSIVPHHNQQNLPAGAVRFIMSLRATGEGHVSSIVFRTGVIYSDHQIQIDPCSRHTKPVRIVPDKQYDKALFRRKLKDIGVPRKWRISCCTACADSFTSAQLEHAVTEARAEVIRAAAPIDESLQDILWLARSNYQLELAREAEASEVVIFPQTSNESHGIEDLRMVRFVDDDGTITYYGTCTAFDGYRVLPQLIETRDFLKIGVHTINGARRRTRAWHSSRGGSAGTM